MFSRIRKITAVCLMAAGLSLGAAPALAADGAQSLVYVDDNSGYPLMGAQCYGWAIGYCVESGKLVPCRCAKVLLCGVWAWAWVPANTPPA